ncbi:DUF2905 domain-containing protein [Mucilaginibacter sp. KACC 22063]|uniref:DUF2905 domain-containing protein n=1 Tax=Mucilaginibacter sp. KACC 22063 TaxID=3025666 RepID=UPI002365F2D1|nr:DUF2905 domain-containing protein [Mucilaginibacter sp. KACC 22063]WDF55391.1 DUF2905 domain-containing protein [Mucilaginibacter sp. KACC 22063]
MDNDGVGKVLIVIGGVVLIAGIVIYFFGSKLNWLGNLPGDIRIERENFRFYFPFTTLLLLNVLLYIIVRIWRWLNW